MQENAFESPGKHAAARPLAALRNGLLLAAALMAAPAFAAPQVASPKEHKAAKAAPAKKVAKAPQKATTAKASQKATVAKASHKASIAKASQKATVAKASQKAAIARAPQKATIAKAPQKPHAPQKTTTAKADAGKMTAKKTIAKKETQATRTGRLADFGQASAPADVTHLANWVSYTRNNQKKAFVLIDKKMARMYVFDPQGKLRSHAPVLLGKAVGDHSAPGIGTKPLSQIKEEEKTTPAGRFLVRPGKNTQGEDILWIDYNAAVSMHRLRKVAEEEKRAERMATADVSDNRISNGCVNVPHAFYNGVLKPTVMKYGAFVYVLPETRSPQQLFGSFEVPGSGEKLASGEKPAKG